MQTSAHQGHHSATKYFVIFAGLIGLTVLTYVTAKIDLGAFNFPLAMAIATTKATLVVLFFMHLSEHKGTSALVFVSSIFFVALLIGTVISDVGTRWEWTNPPETMMGQGNRPGAPSPTGQRDMTVVPQAEDGAPTPPVSH